MTCMFKNRDQNPKKTTKSITFATRGPHALTVTRVSETEWLKWPNKLRKTC